MRPTCPSHNLADLKGSESILFPLPNYTLFEYIGCLTMENKRNFSGLLSWHQQCGGQRWHWVRPHHEGAELTGTAGCVHVRLEEVARPVHMQFVGLGAHRAGVRHHDALYVLQDAAVRQLKGGGKSANKTGSGSKLRHGTSHTLTSLWKSSSLRGLGSCFNAIGRKEPAHK